VRREDESPLNGRADRPTDVAHFRDPPEPRTLCVPGADRRRGGAGLHGVGYYACTHDLEGAFRRDLDFRPPLTVWPAGPSASGRIGMRCSAEQSHTRRMALFSGRFRDPRSTEYDVISLIIVRCPGCGKAARVVPAPGDSDPGGRILFRPRRLVCRGCGLSRVWSGRLVALSCGTRQSATNPYFGMPLWLQHETRHGWLWAYNLEHLDLIRRFVQASLRERAPWYDTGQRMTLVARLPAWIKRAKNRDEILRAVGRIHAALIATRRADQPPNGTRT
jgi:hypothetical protein